MKKRGWPDAAAMLEQVGRGVIDDRMVAASDDAETATLKKRARHPAPRQGGADQAGDAGVHRSGLTGSLIG